MALIPLAMHSSAISLRTTSYPAAAMTCAIPEPMKPAPITMILLISILLPPLPLSISSIARRHSSVVPHDHRHPLTPFGGHCRHAEPAAPATEFMHDLRQQHRPRRTPGISHGKGAAARIYPFRH